MRLPAAFQEVRLPAAQMLLKSAANVAVLTGRFAPSPTGPLHFGSLVTAVASYIDARSRGGRWLVRIEDLDTPRNVPGADADILRTLEAFGFQWDGPVLYQSTRLDAYRAALDQLKRGGHAYPCSCTRTTTAPCTCTTGNRWRVRFPGDDFTILRADGIFAYQLAVVVDCTPSSRVATSAR